jgi:hypothetical protein
VNESILTTVERYVLIDAEKTKIDAYAIRECRSQTSKMVVGEYNPWHRPVSVLLGCDSKRQGQLGGINLAYP